MVDISNNAKYIINAIEKYGYQAYAVGGCVRDYIMGRPCNDVDVASSAKPEETEDIFKKENIDFYETGLKHGTITAVINTENIEVTTFRSDGEYKDNRHPENVCFVTDIESDLARRDFTINAMAYSDSTGIIDLFSGQQDIENRLIRAVGNPEKRFEEDALRIMRGLRFASTLCFEIEEKTKGAMFEKKELLNNVSNERIFEELSKLLMGDNVYKILMDYQEIIGVILPEIKAIFNVEQNTKWHIYDVWQHTAKAVEAAPKDISLRLTMLLHDIGKAYTRTTDEKGCDHFKGHQKVSEIYAHQALKRLKVSNEIYNRVMGLVPIHDMHIGTSAVKIRKALSAYGRERLYDLIAIKRADKLAQNSEMTKKELSNLDLTESLVESVYENSQALKTTDLAVDGNDIISFGITGKDVGSTLNYLLKLVIEEKVNNDKNSLLDIVKNDCKV